MLSRAQSFLAIVTLPVTVIWAITKKRDAAFAGPRATRLLEQRYRKLGTRSRKLSDTQLAIAKERAEIAEAIHELKKTALGPVYDGGSLTKTGMADMDWDEP